MDHDENQEAERVRKMQAEWAQTFDQLGRGFADIARVMLPALDSFARSAAAFLKSNGPALLAFAKSIQEWPERTRRTLSVLARHGWYLDPEMDAVQGASFARLFEEGRGEAADLALIAHFQERAEGLEKELCAEYPRRAAILREAFAAHREKRYALSVPVFLAQADGIGFDLTKVQVFSRRPGATLADFLKTEGIDDDFTMALLTPLTGDFPINLGRRGLEDDTAVLNRHAILHGETVNYATEINDAKALSFLGFAAWALSDLKRAKPPQPPKQV